MLFILNPIQSLPGQCGWNDMEEKKKTMNKKIFHCNLDITFSYFWRMHLLCQGVTSQFLNHPSKNHMSICLFYG